MLAFLNQHTNQPAFQARLPLQLKRNIPLKHVFIWNVYVFICLAEGRIPAKTAACAPLYFPPPCYILSIHAQLRLCRTLNKVLAQGYSSRNPAGIKNSSPPVTSLFPKLLSLPRSVQGEIFRLFLSCTLRKKRNENVPMKVQTLVTGVASCGYI